MRISLAPIPSLLATALCVVGALLASADAAPGTGSEGRIHGMTLSTPGGGADWGSSAIVGTIEDLRALGVDWIAIHPYGRIGRDGTVSWRSGRGRFGERGGGARARRDPGDLRDPRQLRSEAPGWLRRPIEEAHRQGIKILVKPHLAYWGSGFSWRGEVEFDGRDEWERFFATYGDWITAMAAFSHDADGFAVGTELDRTVGHEERWREIIDAVRSVYPGPLTYAANWSDYEDVPFWDALDAVGIQAYFPLVREGAGDGGAGDLGGAPSAETLAAGWRGIMERMRGFSARTGKPIVFTELGYNLSAKAPYEPWDYEVGGPDAETVQELCMTVALRAIEAEPAVVGAFLWKWFPGNRTPRNFAMSTAAMRRVIARHWGPPAGTR